MQLGYIGLGKMGLNMVERLSARGYSITGFDPDETARVRAEKVGVAVTETVESLMETLTAPRTIWIMVPHDVVEIVLSEIEPHLKEGDTIIEGGNSPFKESKRRAEQFESKGVNFLDAGVSGGPGGARHGACIMVGGVKETFDSYEQLFKDLTVENGYAYVGGHGSGHFVKMVHNGIEYGMMQAIAEGFDVMRQANFTQALPLSTIATLYNHGSVIESRLITWLADGYKKHGEALDDVTGSASASGEGLWTVETAKEMGIATPVIEDSLRVRNESQKNPHYQGKIISVLRNQFGGHDAKK